jgi:hypothetical protein
MWVAISAFTPFARYAVIEDGVVRRQARLFQRAEKQKEWQ